MRRTVACSFVDEFESRPDTGWRIKHRVVVIEWVRLDRRDAFLELDETWVRSSRDDDPAWDLG